MANENKGTMFVLSSPSGAGKTTLTKKLSENNLDFITSISHTTRTPRPNEVNGKDYYFVDKKEFDLHVKKNNFFEYAKIFDNFYGTLKEPVIKFINSGKDVLFDIDWQGSKQIKKLKLKHRLISIFILPPNIKTLRDRLSNRDIKDKLILKERMSQFKYDVLHWKEYQHVVINSDLEECYQTIMSIINCEKKGEKFLFDQKNIKKKVSELIK